MLQKELIQRMFTVFRRFPKIPVPKYMKHDSYGLVKGTFPGETELLKMIPTDVPNGKPCFIILGCLIFDSSSKFLWPFFALLVICILLLLNKSFEVLHTIY